MKECKHKATCSLARQGKCNKAQCGDYTMEPEPKPDIGPPPRFLWIEERIKVVCTCIANAKESHPEWYNELSELLMMKRRK